MDCENVTVSSTLAGLITVSQVSAQLVSSVVVVVMLRSLGEHFISGRFDLTIPNSNRLSPICDGL